VEVVWSSRISSGCGDLWIVKGLHRQFFLLHLWDGCGLFDSFGDFPSATNNVQDDSGRSGSGAAVDMACMLKMKGFLKISL
jgi:hypothetical protein